MSTIDLVKIQNLIIDTAADVGIKVLGAIALWLIGRWLIGFALRIVRGGLERQHIDPTVVRYVGSIVSVTLNILLSLVFWVTSESRPPPSPRCLQRQVLRLALLGLDFYLILQRAFS